MSFNSDNILYVAFETPYAAANSPYIDQLLADVFKITAWLISEKFSATAIMAGGTIIQFTLPSNSSQEKLKVLLSIHASNFGIISVQQKEFRIMVDAEDTLINGLMVTIDVLRSYSFHRYLWVSFNGSKEMQIGRFREASIEICNLLINSGFPVVDVVELGSKLKILLSAYNTQQKLEALLQSQADDLGIISLQQLIDKIKTPLEESLVPTLRIHLV